MREGPPLHAGEHGPVDGPRILLTAHDETRPRPGKGLVGGRRHDIAEGHGIGVQPGRDEARDMGDVGQQQGADLVGDPAESGEVDDARIGAVAADDQPGSVLESQSADLVVVDRLGVAAHVVRHGIVDHAREVQRQAVRQVAAVRELHGQERVARLEQREQRRQVRRRTRVRLHVGVLGPEQLLGTVDGQLLDGVDDLTTAVVPRPRVAFGVLVGQHRAGGFEDGATGEVL